MKKLILFLALVMPLSLFAANEKAFTIKAEGMTCGGCVKKVEDKLASLKHQVQGLVITVDQNRAMVDYSKAQLKPGQETEIRAKVEKAITDSGYKIVKS